MRVFLRTLPALKKVLSAICVCLIVVGVAFGGDRPAWANFDDDHFDGNIFALYAGNGSIIPPKVTLKDSFESDRPTLLTFYTEDSRDCKDFASVVSQLQAYYGKVSDIIAISADMLASDQSYSPSEPGFYYKNFLPQTILFDSKGEIVFDELGTVPFEAVDDRYREIFDLLPREESVELKRRPLNEVNASLAE
ncbi:MAG: thylakoid membrane photosystem I accumulation factor [Cyanobacteria bacterium P01_F01_bin.42]